MYLVVGIILFFFSTSALILLMQYAHNYWELSHQGSERSTKSARSVEDINKFFSFIKTLLIKLKHSSQKLASLSKNGKSISTEMLNLLNNLYNKSKKLIGKVINFVQPIKSDLQQEKVEKEVETINTQPQPKKENTESTEEKKQPILEFKFLKKESDFISIEERLIVRMEKETIPDKFLTALELGDLYGQNKKQEDQRQMYLWVMENAEGKVKQLAAQKLMTIR